MVTVMSEVTRILSAIEHGDPHAATQLLPLVYDELRQLAAQKLAQEKPGQTLQATALVHEAHVRLVDVDKAEHWNSRGHFFVRAQTARSSRWASVLVVMTDADAELCQLASPAVHTLRRTLQPQEAASREGPVLSKTCVQKSRSQIALPAR